MIDILALIQQKAGIQLYGKPSRNHKKGMEYHSNCPLCQAGEDRFCIWSQDGSYYCRVCGKFGDAIQFLREYEGLSYYEACTELDIDPQYPEAWKENNLPEIFKAKDEAPNQKWMDAASLFVHRASRYLWTDKGQKTREYLQSRGFTDDTIRQAKIGYVPGWYSESLERWGLSPLEQETDIKVPEGVVIPWYIDGKTWKVSVRRPSGDYFQVLGSSDCLYIPQEWKQDEPVMLVESELDALSIFQTCSDIVHPVATGGTSKGGTEKWIALLKTAKHILVAFDNDEAGHAGANIWLQRLPHATRWTPWAHDTNDMLRDTHLSLRAWCELGLKAAYTQIEVPESVEPVTEEVTSIPIVSHILQEFPTKIAEFSTFQEPIQRKVKNPWDKRDKNGNLEYCSSCRNKAIAWKSNISFEIAFCKEHIPADFGCGSLENNK